MYFYPLRIISDLTWVLIGPTRHTRVVPKVTSNFSLHANWEQQTKESAVVDGTSCCVILECLVTSIACFTWLVSLLTKLHDGETENLPTIPRRSMTRRLMEVQLTVIVGANKDALFALSLLVWIRAQFFMVFSLASKAIHYILKRFLPLTNWFIRGSCRKSWATIFCTVTCFIIDKPNTPPWSA